MKRGLRGNDQWGRAGVCAVEEEGPVPRETGVRELRLKQR
jgi:hypothetical protein